MNIPAHAKPASFPSTHGKNPKNPRLFLWSLVSALAGFLFGFDTVVISGAEKTIQGLWQLSPGMHGLAMSSALWGGVKGRMAILRGLL